MRLLFVILVLFAVLSGWRVVVEERRDAIRVDTVTALRLRVDLLDRKCSERSAVAPEPAPAAQKVVEAPAPETLPLVWETVADPVQLVGKWGSVEHYPMPTLEVVQGREKSKTPFNLQIQTAGDVNVGCGFYPTGTAYCVVHDAQSPTVGRRVETKVAFEMQGAVLRVGVAKVLEAEFARVVEQ